MDGFIDVIFIEVSHLCICFWGLGNKISDVRHLWVGECGRGFSHDGWLEAVTGCCSEVLIQFLHCLGKVVGCSWPKVKNLAFQVIAPALEASIDFGLWDWFISRFLPLCFLGLEACPLFPSVGIFDKLPSGGRDSFNLTIPSPFLNLSCSYVEFTFCVCRNSYRIIKTEICINYLLSSNLYRQEQE